MHSRAYGNAKLGGAQPEIMAMTLYGYGRELALIGEFDGGIEHLTESLRIERTIDPVNEIEVLRTSSVLGRVYLDTGRPAEALPHLQEALELLKAHGAEDSPQDHIYLAKDIVRAAEASASAEVARSVGEELAQLIAAHGDEGVAFPIERFTPEAVLARLAADLSAEEFRTQP